MNTIEELAGLRQRIGGVEHELAQLKRRIAVIEEAAAAGKATDVAGEANARSATHMEPAQTPPVPVVPGPIAPTVEKTVTTPPLPARAEMMPRPAAATPVFTRAPEPSFLETLRPRLERAQLWPPSGETNREVQLGAWWATRLGIFFAVIGAVFFGAYVSLNTPPWVKFVELLGVSLGVVALGAWLERKTPRFGQVVFAGGLALVFFAAMAAYTVPGVKVLENRLAAACWQVLVTVLIGGIAWRKNSQPVATLAVVLGYVAAWFSFSGGFELFALVSALGFAVLAVGWRRWLAWEAPSVAALVGYWIIYGTLVFGLDVIERATLPVWVWAFVAGGYAVFFWRDDRQGRARETVDSREVWVQNANSSAALGLGWLTAWRAFPECIGIFYTTAAVVLGLAAWRRAKTVPGDVVGAVLVAKALGALTLAVIKWTDPKMTALALLVQAGVLLATNRRLHSRVIATGSVMVVAVSLYYWFGDAYGNVVPAGGLMALGRLCYLVGFMVWALEMARACGVEMAGETRRTVVGFASGIGAVVAWVSAVSLTPESWLPAWLIVTAAVLAGAGFFWKQQAPWATAGAIGLVAHVALWTGLDATLFQPLETWGNAAVVLLPTIAGAWWLGLNGEKSARRRGAWLASAIAWVTLIACVSVGYGAVPSLLTALVIAVVLSVAAPSQPSRKWMWLSVWALAVGTAGCGLAALAGRGVGGIDWVRWIAVLTALIGVACLAAWERGRAQLALESPRGGVAWLTVIFAFLFGAAVALHRGSAAEGLAALAGFAVLASALLSWVWVGALRGAVWLFSLSGMATLWLKGDSEMAVEGVLLVGASWLPALVWAKNERIQKNWTCAGAPVDGTVRMQTWLAGAITAVAIAVLSEGGARVGWFAGAVVVATMLARWKFVATVEVASGLALLGLMMAADLAHGGGAAQPGAGFVAVVAMAVVSLVLPLVLPNGRIWAPTGARGFRDWLYPSAGLAVAMHLMRTQHGELEPYVTVGWAVSALIWFGVGLFGRFRPARLLGLVALALCVPRMFLVDLNSTLYRIIAFCALGGVLLWVGFSYHRFRHLIAGESAADKKPGDDRGA